MESQNCRTMEEDNEVKYAYKDGYLNGLAIAQLIIQKACIDKWGVQEQFYELIHT
jgi:hypothetical protein